MIYEDKMQNKAFQDYYSDHTSHCYGCGRLNTHGYQLKTAWDGKKSLTVHRPDPRYTALPGFVYGGLIASLVDCHGTGTAAAAAWGEGAGAPTRYVTASLHVDFLRPTPIDCELKLTGSVYDIKGRKVVVDVEVWAKGDICARGRVVAVEMPERMMPKGA